MKDMSLKLKTLSEVISPNRKAGRTTGDHQIHWVSATESSVQMQSEAKPQKKWELAEREVS